MIQFHFARGSITGPNLARAYVSEGGSVGTPAQAHVCYGAPYRGGQPCLNAYAGTFNKLQELQIMERAGVSVPKFSVDGSNLALPLLARKLHHTKGKDIIPVLGPLELGWARRTRDFFTQYIPLQTEYRVWAFRTFNIGTYQKVFTRPENYRQFGCNYENGFAFQHCELQREPMDLASKALEALRLDFGAVDILKSQEGKYYVLEVNTAPGTEQGVLARLARRIREWETNMFRTREEVRRRCKSCEYFGCRCGVRRERGAYVCCGKRTCICGKRIK